MTPEQEKKIRDGLIEDGDCIRWRTNGKSAIRRRHPLVNMDGKQYLVRRALYEMEKGAPLRQSIFLIPTCGDECCINPAHQKQLTSKQKSELGAIKGSQTLGRAAKVAAAVRSHSKTKLTMDLAREIRASNESGVAWAKRLGVDEKSIWNIRHYITWKEYAANPFAALFSANDSNRRQA
jgi:hypothetical protein